MALILRNGGSQSPDRWLRELRNNQKAAGIRAAKTMFQTGAALVVTQMPGGTVDWMAVGSAVIVAGVASLGTSLAGLPELEKQ